MRYKLDYGRPYLATGLLRPVLGLSNSLLRIGQLAKGRLLYQTSKPYNCVMLFASRVVLSLASQDSAQAPVSILSSRRDRRCMSRMWWPLPSTPPATPPAPPCPSVLPAAPRSEVRPQSWIKGYQANCQDFQFSVPKKKKKENFVEFEFHEIYSVAGRFMLWYCCCLAISWLAQTCQCWSSFSLDESIC